MLLILEGNVSVDIKYLSSPYDVAFDSKFEAETIESWSKWASVARDNGTPIIMQISHPGRVSPVRAGTRSYFTKNLAPSAIPLKLGNSIVSRAATAVVFGTPREMTRDEIKELVSNFARTARLAAHCGFSGIEVNAAYGYLLAQCMSLDDNRRKDEYGGTAENRARTVVEVVEAIRAAVPESFCIGIKLNSGDHRSHAKLQDCIEQLRLIVEAGLDFIELSGGSYERSKTSFNNARENGEADTSVRGTFFLEFVDAIRSEFPDLPLIVTGGFRSREGMEAAVKNGECDLVGLGRPPALSPRLPRELILCGDIPHAEAQLNDVRVPSSYLQEITGFRAVGITAESVRMPSYNPED